MSILIILVRERDSTSTNNILDRDVEWCRRMYESNDARLECRIGDRILGEGITEGDIHHQLITIKARQVASATSAME